MMSWHGLSGAEPGADNPPPAWHQWPQWRGPLANGTAPLAQPPVTWSETQNVRWKLALPGHGHSSPVVWGDHIFLTAAEPYGDALPPVYNQAPGAHDNLPVTHHHRFLILAISRSQGQILWRKSVREDFPHEGGYYTGSLASNSAVTDGRRVYALLGSRGLYCLDFDGQPLWHRDFGRMQTHHAHGEGSSPALFGDTLIVNWDHEGPSFVEALDAATGKTKWKKDRDEVTSWSTPLVVEHGGSRQVVISATQKIRSYDFETGDLLWECGGLPRNVVASPVAHDGLVIAGNSYDTQRMLAIRLDGARGDLAGTAQVVWTLNRLTPYVPSPVLYDDTLYFIRHNQGILSCLDPATGNLLSEPIRLPAVRNMFASPIAADQRLYFVDREGATTVLRHGFDRGILAVNKLDDIFTASPAAVGRELFLRGARHLYCLADGSKF